jgi:hypothetical protein
VTADLLCRDQSLLVINNMDEVLLKKNQRAFSRSGNAFE